MNFEYVNLGLAFALTNGLGVFALLNSGEFTDLAIETMKISKIKLGLAFTFVNGLGLLTRMMGGSYIKVFLYGAVTFTLVYLGSYI
jgi:hypothetical protein